MNNDCKGTTKKSKYQILVIDFFEKNTVFIFSCFARPAIDARLE